MDSFRNLINLFIWCPLSQYKSNKHYKRSISHPEPVEGCHTSLRDRRSTRLSMTPFYYQCRGRYLDFFGLRPLCDLRSFFLIFFSATIVFANTNKDGKSSRKIESKRIFVGKSSPAANSENYANSSNILPGLIVVKFKDNVNLNSGSARTNISFLDEKILHYQVYSIEKVFPFLENSSLRQASQLKKIFYFRYNSDASPTKIAADFSEDPNIEYAEPKYVYKEMDIPNDTLYGSMEQFARVEAESAWDIVKGDSGNVVIGIVDTGTDWNHEDLFANVWTNPREIPNNGVDDDNNGFKDDVHGWNFENNSNDPTNSPGRNHRTHRSVA